MKLPAQNVITIDAGTGRVIQLSAGAASVFAADPKVAEVHPASATSLFIFGVAPGRTTIAALSAGGGPIAQYDVVVRPSRYGAAEAEAAIARVLPGATVHVETMQNGLAITGQVKTPADADRVVQIVRGYLPSGQTVDNRMSVASGLQVNLRVRIAEMSRNLLRQLGVNWEALGNIGTIGKFPVFPALTLNANKDLIQPVTNPGNPLNLGANFNALIDALAQDELVHILAQPNLTAISGETASFLVGGEFPIPVAQQNNQVTDRVQAVRRQPGLRADRRLGRADHAEGPPGGQPALQPERLPAGRRHVGAGGAFADRAAGRDDGPAGQRRELRDRRSAAGLHQRRRQRAADPGRPADPRSAVPLRQVPAQRDRAGHRRDPVHRAAGRQPDRAAPAHRRLAGTDRPGAYPAAAPELPSRRQREHSEPGGSAAHSRQRRFHRAVTEVLPC